MYIGETLRSTHFSTAVPGDSPTTDGLLAGAFTHWDGQSHMKGGTAAAQSRTSATEQCALERAVTNSATRSSSQARPAATRDRSRRNLDRNNGMPT